MDGGKELSTQTCMGCAVHLRVRVRGYQFIYIYMFIFIKNDNIFTPGYKRGLASSKQVEMS